MTIKRISSYDLALLEIAWTIYEQKQLEDLPEFIEMVQSAATEGNRDLPKRIIFSFPPFKRVYVQTKRETLSVLFSHEGIQYVGPDRFILKANKFPDTVIENLKARFLKKYEGKEASPTIGDIIQISSNMPDPAIVAVSGNRAIDEYKSHYIIIAPEMIEWQEAIKRLTKANEVHTRSLRNNP